MKKMNKKGFTLIEMLVVIAIIAVLVSIVIPTVSSATEKAKEAADVANIRSGIASVTTEALANGDSATNTKTVIMTQTKSGFQSADITAIGGAEDYFTAISTATVGKKAVITWNATDNKVAIAIENVG